MSFSFLKHKALKGKNTSSSLGEGSIVSTSSHTSSSSSLHAIDSASSTIGPLSTELRGSDWIYHALWTSCGESGIPRCFMNIPITFVFNNGVPVKILTTNPNTGYVERVEIEDIRDRNNIGERAFSDRAKGDNDDLLRNLRLCRKMLIEYSVQNLYAKFQLEQKVEHPLIVNACYTDGQAENLTLEQLDNLLVKNAWRLQVSILQGYVPAGSRQQGFYSSTRKVRSLLEVQGAEAADAVTRALAKYAEKAFSITKSNALLLNQRQQQLQQTSQQAQPQHSVNGGSLLKSKTSSRDIKRSAHQQGRGVITLKSKGDFDNEDMKLEVLEMKSIIALDPHDRVIFLYSDYLSVRLEEEKKKEIIPDASSKSLSNENVSKAAKKMTENLIALLAQAKRTGLETEESFAHFDIHRTGYCDADLLIDGLARLGMGVTFTVAEAMIELISGVGATLISLQDFAALLGEPTDVQLLATSSAHNPGSVRGIEIAAAPQESSVSKKKKAKKNIFSPPLKQSLPLSAASLKSSQMSLDNSIHEDDNSIEQNKFTLGGLLDYSHDLGEGSISVIEDDRQDFDESSYSRARFGIDVANGGSGASLVRQHYYDSELPMPSSAYKVSTPPPDHALSLPAWTRKGNFTALKEIQESHTRWMKKQEMNTSKTNVGGDQDMFFLRSKSAGEGVSERVRDTSSPKRNERQSPSPPRSPSPSRRGVTSTRSPKSPKSTKRPGTVSALDLSAEKDQKESLDEELEIEDGISMTYRLITGEGFKAKEELNKTKQEVDAMRYISILEIREKNLEEMKRRREAKELQDEYDEAVKRFGKDVADKDERFISILSAAAAAKDANEKPDIVLPTVDLSFLKDFMSGFGKEVDEKIEKEFDRWLAFTLVVVPDMFMTLDTVQKYLEIILAKYPLARMVLVGVPGLPHTRWPKANAIQPDLQAQSIARLLHRLKSRKSLGGSTEPVYMMGFGTGSYELIKFMSLYLPGLPWLESRIKVLCLVNGFLRPNKSFKRLLKDLKGTIMSGNSQEVNELVALIHFWDEYLASNGRKETIKEFWSTRRGLRREDDGIQGPAHSTSSQFAGVLEQLRGLISPDSFDGSVILKASKVPVVVVQSLEDAFVSAHHAAPFQPENLPPGRISVTKVQDCLNENAVYTCWLKAGHEVLQERPAVVLGLISQFAQLSGIHPVAEDVAQEDDEDEEFDVIALAINRKKAADDEILAKEAEALRLEEEMLAEKRRLKEDVKYQKKKEKAEQRRIKEAQDLMKKNMEEEEMRLMQERLKEEADKKALEDARIEKERIDEKRARAALEKEKRIRLAEERRKREAKAARMKELEFFYEMVRVEKEKKSELMETYKMEFEDRRSIHYQRYMVEVEIHEKSQIRSKERAAEFLKSRREEAIKRVEDQMARKRSEQILLRKQKAQGVLAKMQDLSFKLEGESEDTGYLPNPKHVDKAAAIIAACSRIMKDLLYCRQQSAEALKRQMLTAEKNNLFLRQLESLQHEMGSIRRTIRKLISDNKVEEALTFEADIEKQRRLLASKEETYSELSALRKTQAAQLSITNKVVQVLKLMTRERDAIYRERLDQMKSMSGLNVESIKKFKAEQERLKAEKTRTQVNILTHEKRIFVLERELKRIEDHAVEFCDTDVYIAGIMQRVETKTLRKHLRKEVDDQIALKNKQIKRSNDISIWIQECSDREMRLVRETDKITMAEKSFRQNYDRFCSVSLMDLVHSLTEKQDEAVSEKDQKDYKEALRKAGGEKSQESMGNVDKLDGSVEEIVPPGVLAVRRKDHELRTKDERQFVGIDLVLHPDAYKHVSIVEAEQMQFDDDYQCELTAENIRRIANMSPEVSLALPFLRSKVELNCHRLINIFHRDITDASKVDTDHSNTITSFDKEQALAAVHSYNRQFMDDRLVDSDMMKEAEEIQSILCKESLRDKIRAKSEGEDMHPEEREWLQLDKILSPQLFDNEERDEDIMELKVLKRIDFNAVTPLEIDRVTIPGDESIAKTKNNKLFPNKEGKKYEELRWRFEDGEIVFDYSWKCPFNRQELLSILKANVDDLRNEDAIKARRLMDKYYVSDDESLLGRARIKALHLVSQQISDILDGTAEKEREIKEKRLEAAFGKKKPKMKKSKSRISDLGETKAGDSKESVPISKTETAKEAKTIEIGESPESDKLINLKLSDVSCQNLGKGFERQILSVSLSINDRPLLTTQGKFCEDGIIDFDDDFDLKIPESDALEGKDLSIVLSSFGREEKKPEIENTRNGSTKTSSFVARGTIPLNLAIESYDEDRILAVDLRNPAKKKLHPTFSANLFATLSTPKPESEVTVDVPPQDDEGYDSEKEFESANVRRLWGSWAQIHPASAGLKSQSRIFNSRRFNPEIHHPASYAFVERIVVSELEREMQMLLKTKKSSHSDFDTHKNDSSSQWYIVDSIDELAMLEPKVVQGKTVLLPSPEVLTLCRVDNAALKTRQSRSHKFRIPDREDARVVDMNVVVTYEGNLGKKLGRLAAALYILPDPNDPNSPSLPIPIGYAPYSQQTLNTHDEPGKIVIIHRPSSRPMRPANFQLVIGSASPTKYSILVTATVVMAAMPIIEERINYALEAQARLPICLSELESLKDCIRMIERKLLISQKMIVEAEKETQRCQRLIMIIQQKIEDDDEKQYLLTKERKDLLREMALYEVEFAQWANNYTSRCDERDSVKEGLNLVFEFQRQRIREKKRIKADLTNLRKVLPACIASLRSYTEATELAAKLNTTVQGSTSSGEVVIPRLLTPAEDVRKRCKRQGFRSLEIQEQQFCLLDQALNPQLYEWMREEEEEENERRFRMGLPPKVIKYMDVVEEFRLKKPEIEHILSTPFSMLNRKEVEVRKRLTTYHDDVEQMKKAFAEAAYGYDPGLAERTRAKNPATYTVDEYEWASIDRILHKEVWDYYVNKPLSVQGIVKAKKRSARKRGNEVISNDLSKLAEKEPPTDNVVPPPLVSAADALSGGDDPIKSNNGGGDDNTIGDNSHEDTISANEQSTVSKEKSQKVRDAPVSSSFDNLDRSKLWKCNLSKAELMRIWKGPRLALKTDEERKIYKLLLKFNGTYELYMEELEAANKRKQNAAKLGSHIRFVAAGKTISTDIDIRVRQLLDEIERCRNNKYDFMNSDVLHGSLQRFPTKLLRLHLEEALDSILREEIMDRERADRAKRASDNDEDPLDIYGYAIPKQIESPHTRIANELRARKAALEEGVKKETFEEEIKRRVDHRANRRHLRKLRTKRENEEEELLKAKKMIALTNQTGDALALAMLEAKLGVGGCMACRTKPCVWKVAGDQRAFTRRKKTLEKEITRVKLAVDDQHMESKIARSAMMGGTPKFIRMDLLHELQEEKYDCDRMLSLIKVDKEYHDAVASKDDFFEVKSLHGYSVLLRTSNARIALSREVERLISLDVARDAIDGILDWMMEGWYFGEVDTKYAGIQDTKKNEPNKDGLMIVSGVVIDHRKMIAIQKREEEAKKRFAEDKRKEMLEMQGHAVDPHHAKHEAPHLSKDAIKKHEMEEKAAEEAKKENDAKDANNRFNPDGTLKLPPSEQARVREEEAASKIKVARDGNRHEQILNATEQSIRFGLFCLTIMYFRSMYYLRKGFKIDQVKEGENGVIMMTEERANQLHEEAKAAARKKKVDLILARTRVGDARRVDREREEKREAILHLQELVQRQKQELDSVTSIQALYRGQIGKKAGKRWALKRTEIMAINALLNACAVRIQRQFRGFRARVFVITKRLQMAQLIALMRDQEASVDEEVYWETHPWQRFKRRQREWVDKKFRSQDQIHVVGTAMLNEEMQERELEAHQRNMEELGLDNEEDEELHEQLNAKAAEAEAEAQKHMLLNEEEEETEKT